LKENKPNDVGSPRGHLLVYASVAKTLCGGTPFGISRITQAAPALTKQQHFTISRHASPCGGFLFSLAHHSLKSPRVFVRLDQVG
jgi:hypothetical protein